MKSNSSAKGIEEDRSMKVSVKVKTFIYVGMNFGLLVWSGASFLEGMSAQRFLFVYLGSTVWINLMLWVGFRMRDKGRL
jgi:hypothetical protein